MNGIATRVLLAATLATGVLAAAWAAPAAALPCAVMAPPEIRESAFDVGGLFARGADELKATGRDQLAAFVQTLDAADIQLTIVRMPVATDTAKALAQKRALALRDQLVRLGIARKRIYTEVAGPPIQSEQVVIETIALWSPAPQASSARSSAATCRKSSADAPSGPTDRNGRRVYLA